MIDKEKQNAKNSLKAILKWEWATDGRKFNGDHKEVLKHIMDLARLGLPIRELRKLKKP
jgi:hypothetical protein